MKPCTMLVAGIKILTYRFSWDRQTPLYKARKNFDVKNAVKSRPINNKRIFEEKLLISWQANESKFLQLK
jgi:hypothetical protein